MNTLIVIRTRWDYVDSLTKSVTTAEKKSCELLEWVWLNSRLSSMEQMASLWDSELASSPSYMKTSTFFHLIFLKDNLHVIMECLEERWFRNPNNNMALRSKPCSHPVLWKSELLHFRELKACEFSSASAVGMSFNHSQVI